MTHYFLAVECKSNWEWILFHEILKKKIMCNNLHRKTQSLSLYFIEKFLGKLSPNTSFLHPVNLNPTAH